MTNNNRIAIVFFLKFCRFFCEILAIASVYRVTDSFKELLYGKKMLNSSGDSPESDNRLAGWFCEDQYLQNH